ncbi:MAG: YIP1 family protein, partial [Nitrospirae bacterium]|nr:YIP1 family protein [Nitrospirota bacterium]
MALLKHALPMLLRPKSEWSVISAKTITPFELYLGYVVPLNIISPVAATVGIVEFIVSSASVPEQWVALYWRATFSSLIASYLWHLIEIYLLAHVANCFAPLFSGERHFLQALKVLAFAMTPICLGQIFLAVPIFSLDKSMVILSLFYSGYLLWLGLSVLMKVQPLKAFLHASIIAMAFWATSEAPK